MSENINQDQLGESASTKSGIYLLDDLMSSLHNLGNIDRDYYCDLYRLNDADFLSLLRSRSLRCINLDAVSNLDMITLSDANIHPEFTALLTSGKALCAEKTIEKKGLTRSEHVMSKQIGIEPWEYARYFLETGGIFALDPITLRPTKASRYIMIDNGRIVNIYQGIRPFYTVTSGWRGLLAGVYIPTKKIVIVAKNIEAIPDFEKHILDVFHRVDAALVRDNINIVRNEDPELGLSVGFVNNLGHYFWQEMSGLCDFVERGLDENIDVLICGPYCFINPLDLFPELDGIKIFRHTSGQSNNFEINKTHTAVVRPIGTTISSSLRERIWTHSEKTVPHTKLKAIESASGKYFLVWVNLRIHNKCWVDQAIGLAQAINFISSKVAKPVAVVVDGWRDTVSIFEEITRLLPPELVVFDAIDVRLEESIIWSANVNMFISVIGSGLVINSWLTAKPGLAHGNVVHQYQQTFWNHVSQDSNSTYFLDSVKDVDAGVVYSNYSLNIDEMIIKIGRLIDIHYPELISS